MRALDIAIALVLIQASIGLINEFHIFDGGSGVNYYENDTARYREYNITNLEDSAKDIQSTNTWDNIMGGVGLVGSAVSLIYQIFVSILFIYPALANNFGIPSQISGVLQIGIWFMYAIGIFQVLTGKSTKLYD